jgi:hypothetical protein
MRQESTERSRTEPEPEPEELTRARARLDLAVVNFVHVAAGWGPSTGKLGLISRELSALLAEPLEADDLEPDCEHDVEHRFVDVDLSIVLLKREIIRYQRVRNPKIVLK